MASQISSKFTAGKPPVTCNSCRSVAVYVASFCQRSQSRLLPNSHRLLLDTAQLFQSQSGDETDDKPQQEIVGGGSVCDQVLNLLVQLHGKTAAAGEESLKHVSKRKILEAYQRVTNKHSNSGSNTSTSELKTQTASGQQISTVSKLSISERKAVKRDETWLRIQNVFIQFLSEISQRPSVDEYSPATFKIPGGQWKIIAQRISHPTLTLADPLTQSERLFIQRKMGKPKNAPSAWLLFLGELQRHLVLTGADTEDFCESAASTAALTGGNQTQFVKAARHRWDSLSPKQKELYVRRYRSILAEQVAETEEWLHGHGGAVVIEQGLIRHRNVYALPKRNRNTN